MSAISAISWFINDVLYLSDFAILNTKCSDYCCIIGLISKNEATNLMQNAYLTEKIVYNEKHLKAKIKSYNGKIISNFHNNKIPREVSQ